MSGDVSRVGKHKISVRCICQEPGDDRESTPAEENEAVGQS